MVTLNFTAHLAAGETLTGAITVSITTVTGTDASPASVLNGAATFDVTNKMILQGVKSGTTGCNYRLKAKSGTSAGRTLALAGILPVRDA